MNCLQGIPEESVLQEGLLWEQQRELAVPFAE